VIGRLAIRPALAVVILIVCFGVACGGESEHTGRREAAQSEAFTGTPVGATAPDIKVDPVEKCELWPGWSVSGGDVVNLFLPVRNAGNAVLNALVSVRAEGSSGLAGSAFWDGKASWTVAGVAITGQEYGQQQRFTIIADPENVITELDESNNEMTVLVDFPSAPPSTTAALNCVSPAP
jgi:hypothetical protein